MAWHEEAPIVEVKELVGGAAQLCAPTTTMARAAGRMIEEGVGSLGVKGAEGLAGIVTERDVLRAVAAGADLRSETVTDWMTPDPDTVDADMSVDDAAIWMVAAGYRHLPVRSGNELIGIASIKDVLWAITEQHLQQERDNARDA
jgi:CBS domain-containing protein